MYRRAITALLLGNAVLAAGAFRMSDLEGEVLKEASAETSAAKYEIERQSEVEDVSCMEIVYSRASQNRKIIYDLLEETAEIEEGVSAQEGTAEYEYDLSAQEGTAEYEYDLSTQEGTVEYVYDLSERDMELLLRIVEAEAGCEDEDGRLLVANVVLNRMESELFPDSVAEVVLQTSNGVSQFSPVSSGSIWTVEISEETREAVEKALEGENISQGALFFAARKYADSKRMKWFDEKLDFLFEHGGHDFFTLK